MKKRLSPLLLSLFLLPLCSSLQASEPLKEFTPKALWPDDRGVHINAHGGGLLEDGGIYYWFGEHKIAGKAGNNAEVGVHCYSSKDLYNWKDEGIALKVEEAPDHPITRGCILERPKVIFNKKTGKYVMWFHLELKNKGYSSAYAGTAVSDKPAGPYTFVRAGRVNPGKWPVNMPESEKTLEKAPEAPRLNSSAFPPGTNEYAFLKRDFKQGQMSRDMTLFVDDDGKAYHIYSSEENGTTHIAELSDDYLSHSGKYVRAFPGRFMEAPAICKKDGKYYFIASGCTGWAPNTARSAVADSILGPWTEQGNPCTGPDAHTTFRGQSTYILKAPGSRNDYIFMADQWTPDNAIDGRYIWLPIEFDGDRMKIQWREKWSLNDLKENSK